MPDSAACCVADTVWLSVPFGSGIPIRPVGQSVIRRLTDREQEEIGPLHRLWPSREVSVSGVDRALIACSLVLWLKIKNRLLCL